MSELTVTHSLPPTLIVLSLDAIEKLDEMVGAVCALADIPIESEIQFLAANAAFESLHRLGRDLELARKQLKAPVLDIGRQIDESTKGYQGAIDEAKQRLGKVIREFQQAENARRDALRLAAEAKALAEERERVAFAEAEANALRKAAGTAPTDVMEALPIVKPVIPQWSPPPMKSAVRETMRKRLIIDDAESVPIKVSGVRVLVPDEAAIIQLLKAGLDVPGCRLVDEKSISAKASR